MFLGLTKVTNKGCDWRFDLLSKEMAVLGYVRENTFLRNPSSRNILPACFSHPEGRRIELFIASLMMSKTGLSDGTGRGSLLQYTYLSSVSTDMMCIWLSYFINPLHKILASLLLRRHSALSFSHVPQG